MQIPIPNSYSVDEERNPVTPVENGRKVTSITIEPYRSAADEHGL